MSARRARTAPVAETASDLLLGEIVNRLVSTYRPDRIYLFGSRARAAAGSDSDYDLMVVVPDDAPSALRRAAPAYAALWGLRAAVDVLVWTRTAFEERLHLAASLPSTVLREGRLVYSA
ncbi:MAG: DNA polymerase III subunit beta [Candidatus Rokubacteria bacterium RBG_16_73_20]|nr:MAG: DNA polymerase III subunit beta [Candidatus Rokubacteria bacterium GWA2_73_35]OGK96294.1 MAG: DNA polymerase III subunit beta [Candidatus Rokubacteria bacterium RBG_16_73_20]